MRLEKQTRIRNQRGIAMIMALLALFLLALIGVAFMTMTNTENSANRNYKDSQKAYFASRAGLESARAMLTPPNPTTGLGAGPLFAWTVALDGKMPDKNLPNIIYWANSTDPKASDIDPTSGPPTTPTTDDELCQELYGNLGLTSPSSTTSWSAQSAALPCGSDGTGTELLTSTTPFKLIPASGQMPDAGTASALPFKWVRIANKQNFMGLVGQPLPTSTGATTYGYQVCWDGTQEQVIPTGQTCIGNPSGDMRPVWLLTSLAVTPGGSRRMTQMEVALTPPISVNATIATSGTIKLTGKVTVNGNDDCTTDKSKKSVYSGACVPGSTGCQPAITNLVPPDQLTGNNGQTGVTIYNPTGGVLMNGSTGQGPWPYKVDQLINTYKQIAQSATASPWFYPAGGCSSTCKVQNETFGIFPTNSTSNPIASAGTPAIVYVPGNLKLDSPKATGDGLLIVDGDLTVDGGLEYYGLILVKGQIHFTGGSSQGVNLFGAILAGDRASAADTVGGSFSFRYSSCALSQTAPQTPPKLLATHEVVF